MVDAAASARPVLERDTSSKRKFSFLGHTRYRVELPEALRAPTVTKQGLIVGSLPDDYQPTPLDIVCGRGRGNYNCPGNLLFRQIVSESVDEYLAAANKQAKTDVLKRVLQQVQEQSQNKCQFIKQCPDTNKWCLLNETAAREKAGHAMREACATRKKLNTSKKACRSSNNAKPPTNDALLDSVNSASTASTATTSVSTQAPSSVSSRSGLTYLGDSSRTEFANASVSGDSSRSLQLQHVPPQHSVAIPPPVTAPAHEQEGGLAMPLPASMILPATMNQPTTPTGMLGGDELAADSSRNLSGSRQNSARNLLSSVGNLLSGKQQHQPPNAPRNSLLGSASDFDIGGLSDELQSRMSLNDDNNSTTTWAKSSLTSMPPKRKSLEEPLGQHFSLDDLPNDNDDDGKVDVLDLHPKADQGFPTVAAHAAGSGQSGQVFGQAVADLPVRLHAEKEDALRKRQSMLSGGDSVLSAVGSSTFLANQRSSDFFAQFTE